jgi:hypothetical protein
MLYIIEMSDSVCVTMDGKRTIRFARARMNVGRRPGAMRWKRSSVSLMKKLMVSMLIGSQETEEEDEEEEEEAWGAVEEGDGGAGLSAESNFMS